MSVVGERADSTAAELRKVWCRDPATGAARGVTLDVKRETALALVGDSGACALLLGLLAGRRKQQAGSVMVLGNDPASREGKRRVGAVLGEEVLALRGYVGSIMLATEIVRPGWDGVYADALCHRFGLQPWDRVESMSPSRRTLVAAVLAFAHRPGLLLLDLASLQLDGEDAGMIWEAVIDAMCLDGAAVVFTTHDLDEAERRADSIAVIERGRVVLLQRAGYESQAMKDLPSRSPVTPDVMGPLSLLMAVVARGVRSGIVQPANFPRRAVPAGLRQRAWYGRNQAAVVTCCR